MQIKTTPSYLLAHVESYYLLHYMVVEVSWMSHEVLLYYSHFEPYSRLVSFAQEVEYSHLEKPL